MLPSWRSALHILLFFLISLVPSICLPWQKLMLSLTPSTTRASIPSFFTWESKINIWNISQALLANLPTLSLTHTPDIEVFPNRPAPTQTFLLFLVGLLFSCSLLKSYPCAGFLQLGTGAKPGSGAALTGLAHPPPPAWFIQEMSQSNVYEIFVLQSPW